MIIRFADEYKYLSNFYIVDILNKYDGFTYKSVEHAYMSMKSDLIEWKEYCRSYETTCGQVKRKSYEIELIAGWEIKKIEYMESFILYKFSSNPELAEKLMDTGYQNLIEGNYHGDIFWGIDLKQDPAVGENFLGRILMKVRAQLQKEKRGFYNI